MDSRQLLEQVRDLSNQGDILRQNYENTAKTREAELRQQYGIDDRNANLENLRKSVYDTSKVLRNLPENVTNRVKGRLVTQGQRDRLLASEQSPLAMQLADLSGTRDVEQQGLAQYQGLIKDTLGGIYDEYGRARETLADKRNTAWGAYEQAAAMDRQRQAEATQQYLAQIQAAAMDRQLALQKQLYDLQNTSTTPTGTVSLNPAITGANAAMAGIGKGSTGLTRAVQPVVNALTLGGRSNTVSSSPVDGYQKALALARLQRANPNMNFSGY